jgi:hypothetical protein
MHVRANQSLALESHASPPQGPPGLLVLIPIINTKLIPSTYHRSPRPSVVRPRILPELAGLPPHREQRLRTIEPSLVVPELGNSWLLSFGGADCSNHLDALLLPRPAHS